MQPEELHLDGNAAAGALRELFAADMTDSAVTCAGCGCTRPLAGLMAYGQEMGVVLRCPDCDTAVFRLVRGPSWLRADFTGLSLVTVRE